MKLKFCVKEIPRVELDVEGASADDSGKVCKEQRQQDAIRCLNCFLHFVDAKFQQYLGRISCLNLFNFFEANFQESDNIWEEYNYFAQNCLGFR